MLSAISKDLGIFLVGGSIPELRDGKLYNTSTIFGPDGVMIGKYSKVKHKTISATDVTLSLTVTSLKCISLHCLLVRCEGH